MDGRSHKRKTSPGRTRGTKRKLTQHGIQEAHKMISRLLSPRTLLGLMCLMLLFSPGLGCRHEIPLPHKDQHPHLEIYKEGLQSYKNGDYTQARKEFEKLLQQTNDPLLKRKAEFARACSVLAGADSAKVQGQGMRLWEEWALDAPETFLYENPHLVYPVLKDYYLKQVTWEKSKQSEQARQKTEQAEVIKLQKKINKLQQENRRLEKQLKALEKLYQDLQQRRKSL